MSRIAGAIRPISPGSRWSRRTGGSPIPRSSLACGIGHYLRELTARGVACIGADVVFSKCWLAKHWVAPAADYVVFDAAAQWPVAAQRFDLVACHDAFYFLPDQPRIAGLLREAVAPGGVLAVSHLHNAAVAGGAMGPARDGAEWATLFPDATVYDERELRRALLAGMHPPRPDGPTIPRSRRGRSSSPAAMRPDR
ncbi:class I SAM-dependent methyltransferase [Sphingomonas aurantiaca]|uniref:class I SAM-dependent methyltransferase n=1 Tax=Sphingomonas aurantiaca TaxID=185949 RepID=UPI003A5BDD41